MHSPVVPGEGVVGKPVTTSPQTKTQHSFSARRTIILTKKALHRVPVQIARETSRVESSARKSSSRGVCVTERDSFTPVLSVCFDLCV